MWLAKTTVRALFYHIGIDSHTTPIFHTFFIRKRGGDYNASSETIKKHENWSQVSQAKLAVTLNFSWNFLTQGSGFQIRNINKHFFSISYTASLLLFKEKLAPGEAVYWVVDWEWNKSLLIRSAKPERQTSVRQPSRRLGAQNGRYLFYSQSTTKDKVLRAR